MSDYEVGSPEELAGELAARGDEVLIVGDGASMHHAEFDELEHVELAGPAAVWPCVDAALLELATPRVEREEFCAPWELEPLYLRASDAEIEWDREASDGQRSSTPPPYSCTRSDADAVISARCCVSKPRCIRGRGACRCS